MDPMTTSLPPSIFNDVVGPVMRGPSSSHSAASVRIARMARDLVGGQPDRVLVEFDTEGSLATTHESQGSDIGLFGGLLGWELEVVAFQRDDRSRPITTARRPLVAMS